VDVIKIFLIVLFYGNYIYDNYFKPMCGDKQSSALNERIRGNNMKISPFNEVVYKKASSSLFVISALITVLLMIIEPIINLKLIVGVSCLVLLVVIYLLIWFYENYRDSITLSINKTQFCVKSGDIFKEEDCFKVIGTNEYFDTSIGDGVVHVPTLLGVYIEKNYRVTENLKDLDSRIVNDMRLGKYKLDVNDNRVTGKKQKYKLGSMFMDRDYLLTAFSKMDDCNKCYQSVVDYINFLFCFWEQLETYYSGKSITMPLFGAGMTKFKDSVIGDQQLLELILLTFKLSQINIAYPAKVTIILLKEKAKKINFTELKKFK